MEHGPAHIRIIVQAVTDWWDDLVGLIIINLLWLASWITIVLGPPATLGLYYVTNQLAGGQGSSLRAFWEGTRRYFFQGWLWMLLNLAAAAIILLNFWFYATVEGMWVDLLKALLVLLAIGWLIVQFYALPYVMEQERKNLALALRNGLFNALAAPGYTLVVFSFAMFVVVVSVGLVFPLFLGGPCLVAIVGNRAVKERLEIYGVRERDAASQETETDEPELGR